jgi:2,5-diketo-D-gluconate reductase A
MDANTTLRLNTGRDMPVFGLGTWQLTNDTAGTIEEALRLGYRMIDTSGDYGTQPGVGDGLRRSGVPRDEVYVTTKVEEHDDAYEATRRNLDELGLEYVELMLIHRPPPRGVGEALWDGLLRAREEGLTRDIGVSNYSVDQMSRLAAASGEMPAVNQIEWSTFGWSREMLDYCRQRQVAIQAYSPLTRARRLDDPRLMAICAEYDMTPAQVLLRWGLQLGVAPIPKANRRDHLAENLDAFERELSDRHMAHLGELNEQSSALGSSLQYA